MNSYYNNIISVKPARLRTSAMFSPPHNMANTMKREKAMDIPLLLILGERSYPTLEALMVQALFQMNTSAHPTLSFAILTMSS